MQAYLTSALTAAAVAVAAFGFGFTATANAAPSGPPRADDTVRALEAKGYNVILNRTGTGPLSACAVTSVRPGQTYSTTDSRGGGSPNETVLAKTVLVDIVC